MSVIPKTNRVRRVAIVRIKLFNKTALFSLASVLLQFLGYAYLIQLDKYRTPQEIFLLLLAANAIVAYLSLILMAIGNWQPDRSFGRLQESFWSVSKISFFSLMGLASVYVGMYIVGNLVNVLVHMMEHPAK